MRIARFVLLAVSVVVSMTIAEVAFRLREGDLAGGPRPYVRPHPVLGWTYVPDLEVTFRNDEYTSHVRFNSFGLPDVERTLVPTPGSARVLALGDSITAGIEVDRSQRFTTLIETALADRGGSVEVIDTGVLGYQTDQELLYYETYGRTFGARLVLLFVYVGNDIGGTLESTGALTSTIVKPRFRLERDELVLQPIPAPANGALSSTPWGFPGGSDVMTSIKNAVYQRSALYRFVSDNWFRFRRWTESQRVPTEWRIYRRLPGDPLADEAWALMRALLIRLRDDVRADGAQLGVVIVPDEMQLNDRGWSEFLARYHLEKGEWDPAWPHERLADLCAEARILCLDLLEVMRDAGPDAYYPKDRHLTPAGHRAVASAVLPWLETSALVRSLR